MMKNRKDDRKTIWENQIIVALVAIVCCALWGSAFPAIKFGYLWFDIPSDAYATQILFAGCRFTMAGILTLVIGSLLSKKALVPKRTSIKKIAVLSVFQTSLHYICFYIGLAHTTGVKSSILNGMNVFVAILIAVFVFRLEKLTWVKVIGSICGFLGILIVNFDGNMDFQFRLDGEGLIILSTTCYGISSALIRLYGKNENSVMLSGYQFAVGGVCMVMIGYLLGGRLETWTGNGVLILLYLALVSAVAYTLWAMLLRYNPVSKVTIYGFFNPVFGASLSALFLNENGQIFGMKEIFALALISVGIVMVQKMRGKE